VRLQVAASLTGLTPPRFVVSYGGIRRSSMMIAALPPRRWFATGLALAAMLVCARAGNASRRRAEKAFARWGERV